MCSKAQSTRRVYGVLRHVLANGSASFQSQPNHANTFRPNPADRAIPHAKDLRAETGSFGAFKPNTFTCARFFLISRARERVWKGMCQLRLLAFAGMIGRQGSSRLHHSDQEMGDPSVPRDACSAQPRSSRCVVVTTIRSARSDHKLLAQCVRACREERRRHITVFWRTYVHIGAESRSRRSPCRLGLSDWGRTTVLGPLLQGVQRCRERPVFWRQRGHLLWPASRRHCDWPDLLS